ncbi:MAG: CDP-alcohol phosphatidyltransferase family protein, partial [Coriobacteriia bacterium]|nr:CDP-alcohol phosphatidyltransferase family protein [Coriobacteriia bacterium]
GLLIIGRLPLWIIVFVLVRDLFMLAGGFVLLNRFGARVPVVFAGKLATTLLYVGFAVLIVNMPLMSGLGWCDFAWLPVFNTEVYPVGFWFVYAGLLLCVFTTIYYVVQGVMTWRICSAAKKEQ